MTDLVRSTSENSQRPTGRATDIPPDHTARGRGALPLAEIRKQHRGARGGTEQRSLCGLRELALKWFFQHLLKTFCSSGSLTSSNCNHLPPGLYSWPTLLHVQNWVVLSFFFLMFLTPALILGESKTTTCAVRPRFLVSIRSLEAETLQSAVRSETPLGESMKKICLCQVSRDQSWFIRWLLIGVI